MPAGSVRAGDPQVATIPLVRRTQPQGRRRHQGAPVARNSPIRVFSGPTEEKGTIKNPSSVDTRPIGGPISPTGGAHCLRKSKQRPCILVEPTAPKKPARKKKITKISGHTLSAGLRWTRYKTNLKTQLKYIKGV